MEGQIKNRHLASFDLLKIISIILIVFHHYQQSFECTFGGINFYKGSFYFGYLVELFFMISGFFAVYSENAVEGSGGAAVKRFLHKLYRIYPFAFIACAFALLVKSFSAGLIGNAAKLHELWNIKSLSANFLLLFRGWPFFSMTGINNPTWYLCILIQCYMLFYFIQWFFGKKRILRLIFYVAVVVVSLITYKFEWIQYETFRGLECFFMGAAGCLLLQFEVVNRLFEKRRVKTRLLIGIASTVVISLSFVLMFLHPSYQRSLLVVGVFPWLMLLAYCFKDFKSQPIQLLAGVSFTVYIWHSPMMAFEKLMIQVTGFEINRNYFTMVLFTVLLWAVSWVIYRYVEMPISGWIRKKERAKNV